MAFILSSVPHRFYTTTRDYNRELGVSDNTLYRWINEFKQDPVNAFRGSGNLKMEEKTFLDMQKRIRQLEMENEILKKAMHIFAKDRN